MTTTYDIPQPFDALEVDHGFWTVQALTPSGTQEWVLIEAGLTERQAKSKARLLNEVLHLQ